MKIVVDKEIHYFVKDKNIKLKMINSVDKIYKNFKDGKIDGKKVDKIYILINTFFEFNQKNKNNKLKNLLILLKSYTKN